MADLKTKFMGIEIKNPIVIGASNLSQDPKMLVQLEKAGAGAIVYKSLFEEQIKLEEVQMEEELHEYDERHAEMTSIFPKLEHSGPKDHLNSLRKAKESLSIPLIASLNAISKETWVDYAKQIEETGVDGIELNFYSLPKDSEVDEQSIIKDQLNIIKSVKKSVKIPVSAKLSPFYTNISHVISEMDKLSIDGFVLFNKLFQPDIDIEKESHVIKASLSNEGDYKLSLRWAGILYKAIKANISSNTGVYSGNDVVKLLLAGTDSVQIVSAIYKNKAEHIKNMLSEIESWMKSHSYDSIKDFKGNLSNKVLKEPTTYSRTQYVNILMQHEEIIKKHSQI
ncbi:MAG: dihydroorotate dehydrogenase-like protein [Bacteroidales bacterium]